MVLYYKIYIRYLSESYKVTADSYPLNIWYMEDAMERFYLKNIELFHFRKFDDITYELNPRMNVVIGKNESGKTTVLEAVTVILGAYLTAFKEYVPSRFVSVVAYMSVLLIMKNQAVKLILEIIHIKK